MSWPLRMATTCWAPGTRRASWSCVPLQARSSAGPNPGGDVVGQRERPAVGEHDERHGPQRPAAVGLADLGEAGVEVDRLQLGVGRERGRHGDQQFVVRWPVGPEQRLDALGDGVDLDHAGDGARVGGGEAADDQPTGRVADDHERAVQVGRGDQARQVVGGVGGRARLLDRRAAAEPVRGPGSCRGGRTRTRA